MTFYRTRVRMRVRAQRFKDIIPIINKACAEVCHHSIWKNRPDREEPPIPPFYRFRYPPGTGL